MKFRLTKTFSDGKVETHNGDYTTREEAVEAGTSVMLSTINITAFDVWELSGHFEKIATTIETYPVKT